MDKGKERKKNRPVGEMPERVAAVQPGTGVTGISFAGPTMEKNTGIVPVHGYILPVSRFLSCSRKKGRQTGYPKTCGDGVPLSFV